MSVHSKPEVDTHYEEVEDSGYTHNVHASDSMDYEHVYNHITKDGTAGAGHEHTYLQVYWRDISLEVVYICYVLTYMGQES